MNTVIYVPKGKRAEYQERFPEVKRIVECSQRTLQILATGKDLRREVFEVPEWARRM